MAQQDWDSVSTQNRPSPYGRSRRPAPRPSPPRPVGQFSVDAAPPLVTPNQDAASGASAASSAAAARRTLETLPSDVRYGTARARREEAEAAATETANARRQLEQGSVGEALQEIRNVIDAARNAQRLARAGGVTGGDRWIGGITGMVGGTAQSDLQGYLDTIRANIAFSRLQRMRNESPTGGAVGNVSDNDLRLLSSTIASLDPAQSDRVFNENLQRVIDTYQRISDRLSQGAPGTEQRAASDLSQAAGAVAQAPGLGQTPQLAPTNAPGGITATDPRESGLAAGVAQQPNQEVSGNVAAGTMYAGPMSQQFLSEFQGAVNAGATREQLNQLLAHQRDVQVQAYHYLQRFYPGLNLERPIPATMPDDQWRLIEEGRRRGRNQQFGPSPVDPQPGSNMLGAAADTDFGAGLTRYAGAMGGDVVGMFDENYRNRMNMLRDRHPTASLIGDIAGSVAPQALLERGAARLAGRAGLDITAQGLSRGIPRLASNAAYGAATGYANAGEGQGLEGAMMGGALGAGGGEAGNLVSRIPGRVLRGIDNAPTRYLNAEGVPMTIGEIARATGTRMGNFVAGIEDKATSIPGVGDMINWGRNAGRRGLNQAALRQAVEPITPPLPNGGRPPSPITATGSEGVQQGQALYGNAYDNALRGVDIPLDAQYGAGMAEVRANGQAIGAEQAPRLDAAINYIDNRLAGPSPQQPPVRGMWNNSRSDIEQMLRASGQPEAGVSTFGRNIESMLPPEAQRSLNGRQFQEALRVLARERADVSGGMGEELKGAFGQASDVVTDAANRAAPEAAPALNAANQAYRNMGIIGDARIRAQGQPDELFTPTQLRSVSTQNTVNYGGRNAARAGQEPFHDLTEAGIAAQGNRIPDSGSAGRAMLGLMAIPTIGGGVGAARNSDDRLGGAQSGAGTALKWGALAALLYSRAGQRTLQTMLTRRPQILRDIGQRINEGRIPVLTRPGQGTVPQMGANFGAGILRSLGYPAPEDEDYMQGYR